MLTELNNDFVIEALFNSNLLMLFIKEDWFVKSY